MTIIERAGPILKARKIIASARDSAAALDYTVAEAESLDWMSLSGHELTGINWELVNAARAVMIGKDAYVERSVRQQAEVIAADCDKTSAEIEDDVIDDLRKTYSERFDALEQMVEAVP